MRLGYRHQVESQMNYSELGVLRLLLWGAVAIENRDTVPGSTRLLSCEGLDMMATFSLYQSCSGWDRRRDIGWRNQSLPGRRSRWSCLLSINRRTLRYSFVLLNGRDLVPTTV